MPHLREAKVGLSRSVEICAAPIPLNRKERGEGAAPIHKSDSLPVHQLVQVAEAARGYKQHGKDEAVVSHVHHGGRSYRLEA